MIKEIKMGDKVFCLDCGREFELTERTFKLSWDCEYIVCPHCGKRHDVQEYHANRAGVTLKGTLAEDEVETTSATRKAICPYKVGDKIITSVIDVTRPRFWADTFLRVVELRVDAVDLSDINLPLLYCSDNNGKWALMYRNAPIYKSIEEAEMVVSGHNQKLQKEIDEYIAQYGQDKFDEMQQPLNRLRAILSSGGNLFYFPKRKID